ncbi:hypothetical protein KR018_011021, partial [Drosophila ironensis]
LAQRFVDGQCVVHQLEVGIGAQVAVLLALGHLLEGFHAGDHEEAVLLRGRIAGACRSVPAAVLPQQLLHLGAGIEEDGVAVNARSGGCYHVVGGDAAVHQRHAAAVDGRAE